jgi:hypothetical protein
MVHGEGPGNTLSALSRQSQVASVVGDAAIGKGETRMSEPDHIQVSVEEVRQIIQSVLSAWSSVLVNCHPIDQLVTVADRCKQRWPTASRKHRRRVRDVAVAIHRERLGYHPLKLTGASNGTFAIERDHLCILDEAIDLIRDQAEGQDDLPLFRRPRR